MVGCAMNRFKSFAVRKPGCRFRRHPSWRSKVTSCRRKGELIRRTICERTGYYVFGARNEPVVKVKNVMYRSDPIIFGMPPGNILELRPAECGQCLVGLEKRE